MTTSHEHYSLATPALTSGKIAMESVPFIKFTHHLLIATSPETPALTLERIAMECVDINKSN